MRVAFFGLPIAAILLAGDGHDIVYAGICRREAPGTRRLRRTIPASRVMVRPDLRIAERAVRAAKPDLLVSWFWTTRLPPSLLGAAPLGAIGVHPSLLPRHRGPDPFFWAIDAGDTETGVTAHRLEAEYDTGAILGRRTLAIDPSWNAWTLAKRLDRPSLALLRDVVRAFAEGKPPREIAQDDAAATAAPAPGDEDLELRRSWPAARIVRRVRAASPWPGAFTEIGGATVVLTRVAETADVPAALAPGQAWVRRGTAVVRAGDAGTRGVALLEARLEEDDRVLDARAIAELVDAARVT